MLEAEDKHRDQAASNLIQTLHYAEAIFKQIGIYEDFKFLVNAIQNHKDPNANDVSLI